MERNPSESRDPAKRPVRDRIDLTATLYGDLRQLAAARLAREWGSQTLQATALVHEAWLRLGGDDQPDWENRAHFFGAAAEAMRRILIERARRRQRIRHGGGLRRVDLETWNWERLDPKTAQERDEGLLLIHEALERFTTGDPATSELVKLHFLAGMKVREAADALGISLRTAERRLAYARAWLGREVRRCRVA